MNAPDDERRQTFRAFKDGCELTAEELPSQIAAKGRYLRDFEFDVLLKDGTLRRLLGNATPLFDSAGNPRGSVCAFMDVTERKSAEEALRQSEERLSMAFAATNDAIWDWDVTNDAMTWNALFEVQYGRLPDTVSAEQWWVERIHPEDREWAMGIRSGSGAPRG
jgi:PAS domain-containing protein